MSTKHNSNGAHSNSNSKKPHSMNNNNNNHKSSSSNNNGSNNKFPSSTNGDGAKKPWTKSNYSNKPKAKVALTKQDRKVLRRERRAGKPNAELIDSANSVYKHSLTRMPAAERTNTIQSIIQSAVGKIYELSQKHDSSRVLQLCVKYGTTAIRQSIITELKGHYLELANNHYAHHLILKLLQHYAIPTRAILLTEFAGNYKQLAASTDSSTVLDYLFASLKNSTAQHQILKEFYLAEFALENKQAATAATTTTANSNNNNNTAKLKLESGLSIPSIVNSLTSILTSSEYINNNNKKQLILNNLYQYLERCVNKELLSFRFNQSLLLNYYYSVDSNNKLKLIDLFNNSTNSYSYLTSSPAGCRLLCEILTNGTSKDRKHIVRNIKPIVFNLSLSQDSHIIVLRAISAIDDTVLLNKSLLNTLIDNQHTILQLTTDLNGSKVLLQLLAEPAQSNKYLSPFEQKILTQEKTVKSIQQNTSNNTEENESAAAEAAVDTDSAAISVDNKVSKKDPKVKHYELLSAVLLPILQAVTADEETVRTLAISATGSNVLREALLQAALIIESSNNSDSTIPASLKSQINEFNNQLKIGLTYLTQAVAIEGTAIVTTQNNNNKSVKLESNDTVKAETDVADDTDTAAASDADVDADSELDESNITAVNTATPTLKAPAPVQVQSVGPLIGERYGHYVLKRLLQSLPISVANQFAADIVESICNAAKSTETDLWRLFATENRSAFVLTALLEAADNKLQQSIKSMLKQSTIIKAIQSAASVVQQQKPDKQLDKQQSKKKQKTDNNTANNSTAPQGSSAGAQSLLKVLNGATATTNANKSATTTTTAKSALPAASVSTVTASTKKVPITTGKTKSIRSKSAADLSDSDASGTGSGSESETTRTTRASKRKAAEAAAK